MTARGVRYVRRGANASPAAAILRAVASKRARRLMFTAIVLSFAALYAHQQHHIAIGHSPLDAGSARAADRSRQHATISYWIDGDTAGVKLAGRSRPVRVRLLGAGAPETQHLTQCGGAAATAYARRQAPAGTRVTITTEPSSGDVVDVYHRTIAYIDGPRGDVGAALIRAGLATVYRFHQRRFARLPRYTANQAAARAARRGSWRSCPDFGSRR